MSEFSEYRVPVTVFCTVNARDYRAAAGFAEIALRQQIAGNPLLEPPVDIVARVAGHETVVKVSDVMETGTAAGNGYLWTQATPKAYQ